MKRIHSLFTIWVFGLAGLCFFAGTTTSIRAQGVIVRGRVLLPFKNPEGIESSAVEPIGDGTYLLVANDKSPKLLIVNATTGEIAKPYLSIPDFQGSNPDWEAMAKDSDNNYYLIGSRSYFISFRLNNEKATKPSDITIEPHPTVLDIKDSLNSIKNELKDPIPEIEGLAVRESFGKKEWVVGMREKDSQTIHIYWGEPVGNKLSLKRFFQFNVTKTEEVNWHLSSIEYIPDWSGFLIVLSTEKEYPKTFYGNVLWFVSDKKSVELQQNSTGKIESFTPTKEQIFDKGMKAEGLAVLSSDKANLKVVVAFDNDRNAAAKLAFVDLSKPIE